MKSTVFSEEEKQMAKKKSLEETLNIPGHKGNANQKHIKIPLQNWCCLVAW
jgi:hypothetical protein